MVWTHFYQFKIICKNLYHIPIDTEKNWIVINAVCCKCTEKVKWYFYFYLYFKYLSTGAHMSGLMVLKLQIPVTNLK